MQYALIQEAWADDGPPPFKVYEEPLFAVAGNDPSGLSNARALEATEAPSARAAAAVSAAAPAYAPAYASGRPRARTTATLDHHAPGDAAPASRPGVGGAPSHSDADSPRGRGEVYDTILFVLAGVLLVLVLDQFVELGNALANVSGHPRRFA